MSFAPRPIHPIQNQSHRFGSNSAAPSRSRGQNRPNSGNSFGNVGNHLITNRSKSNITDFTARRQQQVSGTQTPQLNNFARIPLNASPVGKTTPISPIPTFVPPTPWWLRSLLLLKYSSGILAGGLIFAALTVYSSNVSSQRQWSENYRELESLRRTERQLVVANEVIKNKAAQESSTTKQLVRLDPSQRLYLPVPNPLPASSPKTLGTDPLGKNAQPKSPLAEKNSPNQPLGY